MIRTRILINHVMEPLFAFLALQREKKRIKALPVPCLVIHYRFHESHPISKYTYTAKEEKTLLSNSVGRSFIKWYFGREQSRSKMITGGDGDRREWQRKHILFIEINKEVRS